MEAAAGRGLIGHLRVAGEQAFVFFRLQLPAVVLQCLSKLLGVSKKAKVNSHGCFSLASGAGSCGNSKGVGGVTAIGGGKRRRKNHRSHQRGRLKAGSAAAMVCCLPRRLHTISLSSGSTATTRQNLSTVYE